MARPSEEILEFDKLRELLHGCGRRPRLGGARLMLWPIERIALSWSVSLRLLPRLRLICDPAAKWDLARWLIRQRGWACSISRRRCSGPAELLDAVTLADASLWLRQLLNDTKEKLPLLAARADTLTDFRPLVAGDPARFCLMGRNQRRCVARAAADSRGHGAHSRHLIEKTLERILRSRGQSGGEDYVTRRNDRFVIPVRASERRGVEGVVHAASATGQTVFVEPLETIEFNNRLVQLSDEEAAEIARILEELTAKLLAERVPLERAAATIAEFDSLFARARFTREFDACMPEFSDSAVIALESARHPVLEKYAVGAVGRGGSDDADSGRRGNCSGDQRP